MIRFLFILLFLNLEHSLALEYSPRQYEDSLLRISQHCKNKFKATEALVILSKYYTDRDFAKAYSTAKKANILAKAGNNKIFTAMSYKQMATVFELQELHLDSASYYFHQAMACLQYEKSNEAKAAYLLYKTYSVGSSGIQTVDDNLKIFESAYSKINTTNNNLLKAEIADRYAHAFWQKGFETKKNIFFEEAIKLWQEAQTHFRNANYFEGIVSENGKIATTYLNLHQPDKAIPILKENLITDSLLGNTMKLAGTLMNLGDYYSEVNQLKTAENFYLQSLKLFKKIGYRGGYNWIDLQLTELYKKMKDYKSALSVALKRIDTLAVNIDRTKQKEVYKIRNDYEKKVMFQELNKLKYKNKLNQVELSNTKLQIYSIMATALLVLVILGILFVFYRNKQKLNELNALINGQEEERKRIAEELHDGLGALLAALKININYLDLKPENLSEKEFEAYNTAKSLAEKASEEVHTISHNLLPPLLQHFGLSFALSNLVQQLNSANQTKFTLDYVMPPQRLTPEYELHIYRLILELVQNIIKHAQATYATIHLVEQDDYLSLMIEDDGKGFDVQQNTNGLGLKNVQARVNILKAEMETDTKMGVGTTINIRLPKKHE